MDGGKGEGNLVSRHVDDLKLLTSLPQTLSEELNDVLRTLTYGINKSLVFLIRGESD